ncbi:TnsD family transposase [Psychrobacillus sp.]|uniref:TnsD family transposase n=1 Tax=Psychrobacillus sp. TaxID=1871623 RepID=UPI0028BE8DB6|nr:TnsD family transposase [Psychrobacillus sp.]
MLGWFPKPYDDELIYSLCARYFTKGSSISIRNTLEKCFQGKRSKLTPDFPSNLEVLVEQLEVFEYKSLETLIYKHTPFYYFTNLLIKTQKEVVMKEISKAKKKNIHMSIGQVASTVRESKFFKYCPSCLEYDLKKLGESYWRTSHQLPSVLVCIDHKCLLHLSSVLYRNKNSKLISPSKENCIPTPLNQCIKGTISSGKINQISKVAIESKKLLDDELSFDITQLVSMYRELLRKKDLITINGRVRQADLYRKFVSFYGIEFLSFFQSVPKNKESCWLRTITRKHRISFHPVRHLLLLNFLGKEIESFKQENYEGPFGKGPYPCLNPAAEHYKKMIVTNLKIERCTDTGKPLGTFTCLCEFQYKRLGPDCGPEDKFRYRYIRNFGEVWKKKLIEYIDTEKISYRKAAILLNVDVGTVIKYYKMQKNELNPKIHVEKSSMVHDYRSIWITNKEANPTCSKTELRNSNKKVYTWLYRNDKAWLDNNSPAQLKRAHLNNQRVNWNERDLEILEQIKNYLITLDINDKPVRLTKRHIAIAIDKLSLIEKKIDKLPLTKEFILLIVETKFQYQERLNEWKKKNHFNH